MRSVRRPGLQARLRRTWFLLSRWRRSSAHERALDAELHAYLQSDIDARIRAGESPAEARRQALIDLGGVEQVKELVRDGRTGVWIDGVIQDLRYAVRALRKSPAFTWSVIGSLSLGLGAMIAGFAFANAILFRPLPGIREPQRLIAITVEHLDEARSYWQRQTSVDDYRILAEGFRDVAPIAASYSATVGATLPAARSLRATLVSANYFDVLGARMVLGAPFGTDGDGHDVVVLAHHLWVREFGADPGVLGRVIRVGDYPVQIVGIASADFGGPSVGHGRFGPDLWLPLTLADRVANTYPRWAVRLDPGDRQFEFVGRLAQGREVSHAQALAGVVAGRMAASRQRPAERQRILAANLGDEGRRRFAPLVALVMPVPLLVLAIACVNAVNLLLARASVREREIAVRLSIGASRGRIVRQLLIESLLLAVVSAAVALPLVIVGLHLAEGGLRMSMPLDGVVTGLALVTALASAVAFGLKPALHATGRPPARSLSHSHASDITPRQSRTRRTLVVVQVALSLGLLAVGSQLLAAIRSTDRAAGTDPDQLLMASFDVRQVNMSPDEAERFYALLLNRVSARPEVGAAGIAPPRAIWTFGKGTQADNALVAGIPPYGPRDGGVYLGGYAGGDLFGALGLRVVSGRAFTVEDRQGARPRVAIVNQAFVERELHGVALGKILNVATWGNDKRPFGPPIPVQVVGVIESVIERSYSRGGGGVPAVYLPIALVPDPVLTLYAKSTTSADVLMPIVRDLVHEIDPRVAIADIGSLADVNAQAMAPYIAMARAGALLGAVALMLAAWGLYAVMSHVVAMRSREFAIRMTLGADASTILRMVARQAGRLTLVGGSIGIVAAILIGQVIQAEMHGTASAGVAALLASTSILAVAMLVASLIPAARASRVSPITLLKDA